jgi:hypothetical protein
MRSLLATKITVTLFLREKNLPLAAKKRQPISHNMKQQLCNRSKA